MMVIAMHCNLRPPDVAPVILNLKKWLHVKLKNTFLAFVHRQSKIKFVAARDYGMLCLRQHKNNFSVTTSEAEIKKVSAAKKITTLAKLFSEIEHVENTHGAKLLQRITAFDEG